MLLTEARSRPTLGLLSSHFDGLYQVHFWRGLLRFCRKNECNLMVFGSRLWRGVGVDHRHAELVYQLASTPRIDALCIDTSAFQQQTDLERFLTTRPDLERIPVALTSIGGRKALQFKPDNRGGIRQAVLHLIEVHQCHRFAFVGGPLDVDDARERWDAFREIADECLLEVYDDWVVEAGFDAPSGRDATLRILDSAKGWPEAIVYASDLMALGGLEVLRGRGIQVPLQIRVTGFDDVDLAGCSSPALSTVSQPIEAKAWLAGKSLLDAVLGRPSRAADPLGIKFIPRESCGCPSDKTPARSGRSRPLPQLLVEARRAIEAIAMITQFLGAVLSLVELSHQIQRLVVALNLGPVQISLSERGGHQNTPEKFAVMVCAVEADGTLAVDPGRSRRFLAHQVVPSWLVDTQPGVETLVQSLDKAGRSFGFLTTRLDSADPSVLMALRDHVSEALWNIQHVGDLEASERWHRDRAKALPVFVMEVAPHGQVTYLNDSALDLLGLSEDDLEKGLDARDLSFQQPSTSPDGTGLRPLELRDRQGRRVVILARSIEVAERPGWHRWCGFDYHPVLESFTQPEPALIERFGLTRREAQVLALELRGLVAKEVATELEISVSTVKGHLGLIYRKLGVGSRDQLFTMIGKHHLAEHGYDSVVFSLIAQVLSRSPSAQAEA